MSAKMSRLNLVFLTSALALAVAAGCSSKSQDHDAASASEGGANRQPDSSATDAGSTFAQDAGV